MKRVFLFLLCAAFAMVGCEELEAISNPNNNGGENGTETEQPVFVVNADGEYVIEAEGGKVEVVVATNIDYSVSIPAEAQEWLSHSDTRSIRQETIEFTIAKNSVEQSRSANVELLDGEGKLLEAIAFVQKAAVVTPTSAPLLSARMPVGI